MTGKVFGMNAGRPSSRKTPVSLSDLKDVRPQVRLNVDMDQALFKRLKMFAASKGVSIRSLICEQVELMLDQD
ncbi:chromosome partitioning protein ParB [Sinimarinibacterium sp. NLF-5-8]|uniref:chromosome partitioning protein ParB n=1 Tax=Sinimarinibacterium sp. NLF-5-8 TaxID=2698684 RepID=UPI00137BA76A|nr:chromosome partitioning protein ParB [Sinimarinibacterium sp. NLF-5-8]QHS09161.1 chromosome partitioning protein ParB [Sinimarinibacterium sp. NLF-5-8]